MTMVVTSPALQGHCSQCGKVWTLNERQGVCQWCLKPFTEAVMYRIASRTVADYWRTYYKANNGLDCGSCSKAQRQKCKEDYLYSECPKAINLESLNKPIIDSEGHTTELGELIADDKALDLDAWVDARTFLLGFSQRLLLIADKLNSGQALAVADRKYLCKWRKREQKTLFGGNVSSHNTDLYSGSTDYASGLAGSRIAYY